MIEFSSQNDFVLEQSERVESWLKAASLKESYGIDSLGYVFCSDDFLLEINQQFLDHDTLTDIVTFDYTEGTILNGEIYISTDRVADNAKDFNVDFDTELRRVIIHGLLHMCGYGDKTEEEKLQMRSKEDEYLALWAV
ncbi:MAG: rRNA maturation RNase YbeY [Leeuwenhoekiella sp.]|jgi:rRNA maturation RNase YbeY|uniref:rRNA maturation RNase YbeY n=1 Tax=Leeuwenhoekiella TaxID=283735 RepID=UPI000C56A31A|nr:MULTISPECIES: rRNA maturation RNase YbeY [Leeuwenhoekiella]MAO45276.1 rRNA maturation RNase YbeY [Leeuwenhoekiella sp.]HBT11042.1 rRNA maturation RNase YbeY [Leeuwenhoekiella sp.]HCW63490.1 rRNA maturation RNase YbeY [Leeuwenhoekiella sp.]|tara:strand:+ start:2233 stop:2646 length:414 start_codon:yes stop_codon:yes gene_type:complete